ncbi:MAG: M28 family peptidase, partial [Planctomycetia bacterium]
MEQTASSRLAPQPAVVELQRSVDFERAAADVATFSFPRQVGSRGSLRAAALISRRFDAIGCVVNRQRFSVPVVYRAVVSRSALAAAAALGWWGAATAVESPIAGALIWLLAAVVAQIPWVNMPAVGVLRRCEVSSDNIIGRRPDAAAPARIIFMAHYDSKSQRLSTRWRVALVVLGTGTFLIGATLALAASCGWPALMPEFRVWRTAAIATLFFLPLLFNSSGNRSPGALDNGAGLGLLLELARSWRPRDDAPLDVWFVATGSEESDLDGSREFLRTHGGLWDERPTLLVNLESVGFGRRLFVAGEPSAVRLARRVGADLGDGRPKRLRVLGAVMDHLPFSQRG